MTADIETYAEPPGIYPATLAMAHEMGETKCTRCGVPFTRQADIACFVEGESMPSWYERQNDAVRAIVPITHENFHLFYRPLSDRLAVKLDETPRQTPSGLWYPESFIVQMRYHKPVKGTVMGVGPGMLTYKGWRWPICSDTVGVKPGDRVLFMPQGGFEIIKVGGGLFMSIRDDLVIAQIEEE